MPSFQKEALDLASEKLAGHLCAARYSRLYRAFRDSFLHYTPRTPDHWRHPRGSWSGSPDLPSSGSCVVLAILAYGNDPDEMVLRYHEFLGAMASRLSSVESAYAILSLQAAARFFPDDPRFPRLAGFLKDTAVPPDTPEFRSAEKISDRLTQA